MSNSKVTENVESPLTQSQLAALIPLAAGSKKKEAASSAGVCAQTISQWLRDAHFRAALNAKRQELSALAAARLGKASDAAVTTILDLMERGSESARLKAATFVLERMLLPQPVTSAEAAPTSVEVSRDREDVLEFMRVLKGGSSSDEAQSQS